MSLTTKLIDWLDERLGIRSDIERALRKMVPKQAANPVYCLGGVAFLAFLVEVVTGIALARYYLPDAAFAYESVRVITYEVPLGSLVRSLHYWAGNVMIAAVLLHMLRVYFMGAYRKPRELNWLVGVALLLLTFTFGFSGYALRWDVASYGATSVVVLAPASLPFAGAWVVRVFLGEVAITGETLTRLYFLHVFLIPMAAFTLMIIHFLMVRRQGIASYM
jgi:quinol-cytochrome oxidoreductase complex cytochrome b subunit